MSNVLSNLGHIQELLLGVWGQAGTRSVMNALSLPVCLFDLSLTRHSNKDIWLYRSLSDWLVKVPSLHPVHSFTGWNRENGSGRGLHNWIRYQLRVYQMRVWNTLLQRIQRSFLIRSKAHAMFARNFISKWRLQERKITNKCGVSKQNYWQLHTVLSQFWLVKISERLFLLGVKALKLLGLFLNFGSFSNMELEADLKNHSL